MKIECDYQMLGYVLNKIGNITADQFESVVDAINDYEEEMEIVNSKEDKYKEFCELRKKFDPIPQITKDNEYENKIKELEQDLKNYKVALGESQESSFSYRYELNRIDHKLVEEIETKLYKKFNKIRLENANSGGIVDKLFLTKIGAYELAKTGTNEKEIVIPLSDGMNSHCWGRLQQHLYVALSECKFQEDNSVIKAIQSALCYVPKEFAMNTNGEDRNGKKVELDDAERWNKLEQYLKDELSICEDSNSVADIVSSVVCRVLVETYNKR